MYFYKLYHVYFMSGFYYRQLLVQTLILGVISLKLHGYYQPKLQSQQFIHSTRMGRQFINKLRCVHSFFLIRKIIYDLVRL